MSVCVWVKQQLEKVHEFERKSKVCVGWNKKRTGGNYIMLSNRKI